MKLELIVLSSLVAKSFAVLDIPCGSNLFSVGFDERYTFEDTSYASVSPDHCFEGSDNSLHYMMDPIAAYVNQETSFSVAIDQYMLPLDCSIDDIVIAEDPGIPNGASVTKGNDPTTSWTGENNQLLFSWVPDYRQLENYPNQEYHVNYFVNVVASISGCSTHANLNFDQLSIGFPIQLFRPNIGVTIGGSPMVGVGASNTFEHGKVVARVGCALDLEIGAGDFGPHSQVIITETTRVYVDDNGELTVESDSVGEDEWVGYSAYPTYPHYPIEVNPATPRDLPYGATFYQKSNQAGLYDNLLNYPDETQGFLTYGFEWTPVRGQEGSDYRVCFVANDWFYAYADPKTSWTGEIWRSESLNLVDHSAVSNVHCMTISVSRCEYCVQPDDTFASIAEKYDTDYLQLWSANHWLTKNPDHVNDFQPIYLGPIYTVEQGDDLNKIANKFNLDSIYRILAANPDLNKLDFLDGFDVNTPRTVDQRNNPTGFHLGEPNGFWENEDEVSEGRFRDGQRELDSSKPPLETPSMRALLHFDNDGEEVLNEEEDVWSHAEHGFIFDDGDHSYFASLYDYVYIYYTENSERVEMRGGIYDGVYFGLDGEHNHGRRGEYGGLPGGIHDSFRIFGETETPTQQIKKAAEKKTPTQSPASDYYYEYDYDYEYTAEEHKKHGVTVHMGHNHAYRIFDECNERSIFEDGGVYSNNALKDVEGGSYDFNEMCPELLTNFEHTRDLVDDYDYWFEDYDVRNMFFKGQTEYGYEDLQPREMDKGNHQPKRFFQKGDSDFENFLDYVPEPEDPNAFRAWRSVHHVNEGQKLCIIPPICNSADGSFVTLDEENEDRGSFQNQFPETFELDDPGYSPAADVEGHIYAYEGNRHKSGHFHGGTEPYAGRFVSSHRHFLPEMGFGAEHGGLMSDMVHKWSIWAEGENSNGGNQNEDIKIGDGNQHDGELEAELF